MISVNNVEVDGIPRHVLDIQWVQRFEDERGGDGEDERGGEDEDEPGDEDEDERGGDGEDARGGDGKDERGEDDEEDVGEEDAFPKGWESVGRTASTSASPPKMVGRIRNLLSVTFILTFRLFVLFCLL